MMTAVPIMRAAPGWSPSPFQAPAAPPPPMRPSPALSQTVVANPMTPSASTAGTQPPAFIDSALVGAVLAGLGATAFGILTVGAATAKTPDGRPAPWVKTGIVFGTMSGLLGFKGIMDLYEVRFR